MNPALWHESRYRSAAGWTMFHFVWVGCLVWIAAATLRSIIFRLGPNIRYAAALGLFLATAVMPCGLYVVGLEAVDDMGLAARETESHALGRTGLSTVRPTVNESSRFSESIAPGSQRAVFGWNVAASSP